VGQVALYLHPRIPHENNFLHPQLKASGNDRRCYRPPWIFRNEYRSSACSFCCGDSAVGLAARVREKLPQFQAIRSNPETTIDPMFGKKDPIGLWLLPEQKR
jgi:hypothetical protein